MIKNNISHLKYIKISFTVIFISICIAFLLNVLYGFIPNRLVKPNVDKSLSIMNEQGNRIGIYNDTLIDNFTDKIMVQMAVTDRYEGSFFPDTSAPYYNNLFDKNFNKFQQIFSNRGYPRYWHGYMIILKPMLIFFNINQIRHILTIFMLILFLLCCLCIYKYISPSVSFVFTILTALFAVPVVGYSLTSSVMFFIMFVGVIIISLLIKNKLDTHKNILILITSLGAATVYFDFLTTPLLSLTVPLLILAYHRIKNNGYISKKEGLNFIYYIFSWALAYGLVWISKWIISSVIINRDVVSDGIKQFFYRSNESLSGSEHIGIMQTIEQNFNYIFGHTYLYIFVVLLFSVSSIILIYKARKSKQKLTKTIWTLCIIATISILPIARLLILRNHSFIHGWFVYRTVMGSFFGLLIFLNFNFLKNTKLFKFVHKKINKTKKIF